MTRPDILGQYYQYFDETYAIIGPYAEFSANIYHFIKLY